MNRSKLIAAAGLMALAATSAQAQIYVGSNVGWAKIDFDCADTSSCDRTSTGFKTYGGYRFEQGLAVEGVYFDWGDVSAREQINNVSLSGEINGTGWGLGVAYFLPFATNFSAVVRVGAVYNEGKVRLSSSGLATSDSKNSWQAYGGIGVAYNVMPNLAITAEADFSRVKYGLDGVTETDSAQLYSFGVRFSF